MLEAPLPALPDIDDVPDLTEADDIIFNEIRAVLQRHDALQRFGVTLLHQHFPLAADEVLLERIDRENRVLMIRPHSTDADESSRETSWRLDDPSGARRCETLCQPDRDWEGKPYHRSQHYTTS